MSVSKVIRSERSLFQEELRFISVKLSKDILSPETLMEEIAAEKESAEIFYWFEGIEGLPAKAISLLKKEFLDPLCGKAKGRVTWNLYSLRGWDFSANVEDLPASSEIAAAVDSVRSSAIRCLSASSFFSWCKSVKEESPLYQLVSKSLPGKGWLGDISKEWMARKKASSEELPKTVREFFSGKSSLLDSIYDLDVKLAYSYMQNVEGYYLIRNAVERGIEQGKKKIKIIFTLPNDEGKYYEDFPQQVQEMLKADFGSKIGDLEIDISFRFFSCGKSKGYRPYNRQSSKETMATPQQLLSLLFATPSQPQLFENNRENRPRFPRDMYHDLNE